MASRKPTQADVAKLAGVSQTTVSHVLNNNTLVSLPLETRQRVMNAIEQLGYAPDRNAQSLRTGKTYTIAGIIPDITNPFYPTFERGIQDIAEGENYDLIMYNTDGMAEKERKALHSLQQGRVDGVIAVLFHLRVMDLMPLLENNIPVVRLEARRKNVGGLPLDNLYVDNVAAARTAVNYLIERGHRRIGMIAGQQQGPGNMRLMGYQEALEQHSIPCDEALIQYGAFNEVGGYEGMRALLDMRPTAVFAANDVIATGALMALREAGMRVPDDMAVMGFDDIPMAKLLNPALTTITQFQANLGQRAAQMLFDRLNGAALHEGRCEEMPYELVVRESA
jgi:LacI family transcriptional regulator